MPEQIKASPADQVFAGKTHHLTHPLPVPGAIAMNSTMLADRLRIEGTLHSPGEGIKKKIPAVRAEPVPRQSESLKSRIVGFETDPSLFAPVVGAAINGGEQGKHLEVLAFLAGQGRHLIGGGIHDDQYRWERREMP